MSCFWPRFTAAATAIGTTVTAAPGYPELATAEKGNKCIAAAVERTVEVIQALLNRPLPD